MKEDVAAKGLIFKKFFTPSQTEKKFLQLLIKKSVVIRKVTGLLPLRKVKNGKLAASQALSCFLVENMGRVNFGHKIEEQKKGIYEEFLINTHGHYNCDIFTLPLDEKQMTVLKTKGKWTTGDTGTATARATLQHNSRKIRLSSVLTLTSPSKKAFI